MAIQVRQRRDGREVRRVIVRHECEPQPQFGEPDGGERQIDAKERMREDVALHRERGAVAGSASQRDQLVECAEEKRARAGGGIEYREIVQLRRRLRSDSFVDPSRGDRACQAETGGERGLEPGAYDFAYQRRRRVVAAAGPSLARFHDSLKDAAKHVRCDEVARVVFADGEVKSFEEIIECAAPVGVAPDRRSMLPLEPGWFEQAAVQERDLAEGASGGAAPAGRAIERAKTQRMQERAVKVMPARQRPIEEARHVARVPVEPALGLNEIQEEHAGQGREGERVTVAARSGRRQALGQPIERGTKRPEKAWRDAFTREHFANAQRECERGLAGARG